MIPSNFHYIGDYRAFTFIINVVLIQICFRNQFHARKCIQTFNYRIFITVADQQSFSSALMQTAARRLTRTLAVLATRHVYGMMQERDVNKRSPPVLKGIHVGKEMDAAFLEKMLNTFHVAYFVAKKKRPFTNFNDLIDLQERTCSKMAACCRSDMTVAQ